MVPVRVREAATTQAMVVFQRLFPRAAPLSLSGLAGAICGRLSVVHVDGSEYAKAVATGVYHVSVVLGANSDMSSARWAESFRCFIWLLHGRDASYRDVGFATSLRDAVHGAPPPPLVPARARPARPARSARVRLPGGAWSPLRTVRITRRVRRASTVLTFQ